MGRLSKTSLWALGLFAACLLVGGAVSVQLGPDMNWDLQNYHLYNPFAFLTNRLGQDFMAADIQSYLNPLLDVPFYLAWTNWFHDRPRVTAFLAGIPYGVAIFLCMCIARRLLPGESKFRLVEIFVASAIGVTGTVTLSEVGTTFNDIPIAVLVLGALLVELRRMDECRGPRLLSGFIIGLAAGLKLTAVIFAPGMVLAIMLTRQSLRGAFVAGALFSTGWVIGFGIGGGWWAWKVYQQFGNPIFPMFNGAIGSPWFDNVGRDLRFMPHGVLQALFYPFFWNKGARYVSEVPMHDPRFALAYAGVVVLIIGLVLSCTRKADVQPEIHCGVDQKRSALLVIFFCVSFVIWEGMFSIARYMVALELLTGVIIVLGARWLCLCFMRESMARTASCLVALVVAVFAIKESQPMDWGRMQYDKVPQLVDSRIVLPDGATVLLIGRPVAFLLPFIRSSNSAYVGVDGHVVMLPVTSPATRMIRARLAASEGNIWVLTNQSVEGVDALVKSWGLVAQADACREMSQSPQQNVRLCPLGHLNVALGGSQEG